MSEASELHSARLEEYKSLREEVLLHIKLERQILALTGTVFFLALTFAAKFLPESHADIWSIVIMILLTPLFALYRAELFAIAKIASYIEEFIEPNVKGLRWTGTHIQGVKRFDKASPRAPFKISSHQAAGIYFVVLLVVAWALPWVFDGCTPSWTSLGAMAILSFIYILNLASLLRYGSHRERWQNVWKTIASEDSGGRN